MRSSEILDKKAWERVNELKKDYVIDILTAERLHDIFVYLMLAQTSKNPRGIEMQQTALKNTLRNCPVIAKPAAAGAAAAMMPPAHVNRGGAPQYRAYC